VDVSVLVDPSLPRLMTEADLPWLTQLCRKRYSHKYDAEATQGWYSNIVMKSPLMFYPVRSADAFCITMLSVVPWLASDLDANVVFICCDEGCMWQGLRLLRCSIDWAKRRRATVWRLSSDTEYDFKALAMRLGATEISPRFAKQL
jgi:hypothetical protein